VPKMGEGQAVGPAAQGPEKRWQVGQTRSVRRTDPGDRHGATTDAVLPTLNRVSIAAALGGVVIPTNEFCCDGGSAIVAFARKAGIPTHILPAPGKPNPRAPDFHINNVNAYHGRLKEWMRRFLGVATKNLRNYLGWRRTLEALDDNATSADWILGAIGLGPYQLVTP
jgi:hypothetical protein